MRRAIILVAGALIAGAVSAGVLPAQPSASAVPAVTGSTCIYMVRDVKAGGGIYTGDFLVLRRTGSALKGYGGAFYSEGYNVRGTLAGARATLRTQDPYAGTWGKPVVRKWVVGQNRLAGWRKVAKTVMRKYSGGYVPARGQTCA